MPPGSTNSGVLCRLVSCVASLCNSRKTSLPAPSPKSTEARRPSQRLKRKLALASAQANDLLPGEPLA
eukprot:CAMPEP_0117590898 /NCGR_PEP_ID=MMETSP0784-20121206/71228_1 /TAXON_ID=39447 /ORGANISM="" /LENGTH=67 /DNA_ID=CAMNT_0005392551 /DNA_START=78 /DNA_END=277 /DNA_ORIENTATION=+